jgi:N-methylhydantoinase A/oxoprolinase/acetone carboxylase beta subunit
MAVLLGVDTGGTYTDAVLIRDETEVIASAKALTTRADLAVGVGNAVSAVLAQSGVAADQIAMASLSTTLATNALVEGQGGRVALIYVGFRAPDLEAHGLSEALRGDPCLLLTGGHDHAGAEVAPLDETALIAFLETHRVDVSGFAVASQFATRNPAHEQRVAELVAEVTGRPVSASHSLSAKLNGPKRALTALLNARLIGMIDRLIGRAEDQLRSLGINAPMMVVRGDGALMSSAQARERPIETILSGPAASLVGARWLTGAETALVSDVALLRDGRPAIDPAGAQVGPYRTMVEAVAMRTHGLGGDSEVHFMSQGLTAGVTLGPKRLLPVSLLAVEAGEVVHRALDAQLRRSVVEEHDGRFVRAVPGQAVEGLAPRDLALMERIGTDVWPLGDVLRNRVEQGALTRLVARGLVQVAGVTPSDASHVAGHLSAWDSAAAHKALALFGRKRGGSGLRFCPEPESLAKIIIDQLTNQTALALLETAFAEESPAFDLPPEILARHVLMQRGLSGHRGVLRIDAGLNLPVVGLGASAATYYPAVGERLGSEMILPDHAHVANAIGAVVGRVIMRESGTVTVPHEGVFRVHLANGPQDFPSVERALAEAETALAETARGRAQSAGAAQIECHVTRDIRMAEIEGREVFVEAALTVEASGRPRVAAG